MIFHFYNYLYVRKNCSILIIFSQTQPEVKKKKGKSYDYATKLNYLFRDARFFLVKSSVSENVDLSKVRGVWSTPPANEGRFNKAFRESRNVIMIYSVKESGRFCGFARLGTTHLLRKHFKGGRGSKWQFLLTFGTVFTFEQGDGYTTAICVYFHNQFFLLNIGEGVKKILEMSLRNI